MKTDATIGPHVDLECELFDGVLRIRQFYAGPGHVTLLMKQGRREVSMSVSAAQLIEAVKKLCPGCETENNT
jgi:hypothetical protein